MYGIFFFNLELSWIVFDWWHLIDAFLIRWDIGGYYKWTSMTVKVITFVSEKIHSKFSLSVPWNMKRNKIYSIGSIIFDSKRSLQRSLNFAHLIERKIWLWPFWFCTWNKSAFCASVYICGRFCEIMSKST